MTLTDLLLLSGGGFCAGFIDSSAGGGGLIALPLLLSIGLPPQTALGTNKLQSSVGTLFNSIRQGKVSVRENSVGTLFTFSGAALFTWAIRQLDPDFLEYAVPALLFAIFYLHPTSRHPN